MRIVKFNYREIVDEVIENMDLKNKCCLDATVGRGHDSLKIISKLGEKGTLYGYDIQEEAIRDTKKLLLDNGYDNFKLFNKCHSELEEDITSQLELIIFNLGYLPKSDKKITTLRESTVKAIEKSLNLLSKSGVLIIVSYLGHENSLEERNGVEEYLKNLNQKLFLVEKREFFNQKNNPPIVYLIGRR
ncbi:tRNA (mnm(5)s(2)U34)-methyltransferase [Anaerosphaera multitolerans]|uniref:Methyltransferase domain-containing protein n=1 Tax=Anaerosphaera multitolerans TaxID=2487351 RepID=A0A437S7B3_9FIRM|nr:class I SAM-dependent methyltransferase [Anaerosphaera multitolerans]RVU54945.1 methyltransferase domain-containing protein [Anaerosphaera multitolerans]